MSVYLHLDSIARRDAYVPNIRFSVSATTTQDLGSVFGALTITANRIEPVTAIGPLIIDNVQLNEGMKVLVKDQTTTLQNGIYQLTTQGSFSIPWVLTRISSLNAGTGFAIGNVSVKVNVPERFKAASQIPNGFYRNTTSGTISTDPLVFEEGCIWEPNDYRRQGLDLIQLQGQMPDEVQTPTKYRLYYRELNECINKKTIGFLKHCKERPENLNYSVEFCTVILPSNTSVQIPEYEYDEVTNEYNIININYRSILNEPYIYVRIMPINHAEGNLFSTNNEPANEATFVVWHDKYVLGSTTDIDPSLPIPELDVSGTGQQTVPALDARPRWIVFKSCMITTMRLDLCAESWDIRFYDRYGRDLILLEEAIPDPSIQPPPLDRYKQTSFVLGIRPNYPI